MPFTNGKAQLIKINWLDTPTLSDADGEYQLASRVAAEDEPEALPVSFHYQVSAFFHPHAKRMSRAVRRAGAAGLLRPHTLADRDASLIRQRCTVAPAVPAVGAAIEDPLGLPSFDAIFQANDEIVTSPDESVDFSLTGAYSQYNWEIFFHIPLLVARRFSEAGRFAEAQDLLHGIFDPIHQPPEGTSDPEWRWRLRPLATLATGEEAKREWNAAVEISRQHPFDPHAIARVRPEAYRLATFFAYLDNLIAWGDHLFRQDTLEALGEATQVYALAQGLLGEKPRYPLLSEKEALKYESIRDGFAQTSAGSYLLAQEDEADAGDVEPSVAPGALALSLAAFAVAPNPKYLGYWDTVADRLFKIRAGMNIDGVMRSLSIYAPPIDPGVLIRAVAGGLPFSEALGNLTVAVSPSRFSSVVQMAVNLASDVRAFGAALVTALEKGDSEALQRMRTTHEGHLLGAAREVRRRQLMEAQEQVSALQHGLQSARLRLNFYSERSRKRRNPQETSQLVLAELSAGANAALTAGSAVLAGLEAGGAVAAGIAAAVITGTEKVAGAGGWIRAGVQAASTDFSARSGIAGTRAALLRRDEEWKHQAELATAEIQQISAQLRAAELRVQIAERELENAERQIAQNQEVAEFLSSKYSRESLYAWTATQLRSFHRRSWDLAYGVARQAQRAWEFEIGEDSPVQILPSYGNAGATNSDRLLAGDGLYLDLQALRAAYMDRNRREYEMTRTFSLAQLDPIALATLQETGSCEFDVTEASFDADTPGHYFRRLRTVALTIPCATAPQSMLACKLTLLRSQVRSSPTLTNGRYVEGPSDARFVTRYSSAAVTVTSTGQNDSGTFGSPGDDRYGPFEGLGAISRWRLELPTTFASFDRTTIPDVLVHVQFTARDGGEAFRRAAEASIQTGLESIPVDAETQAAVVAVDLAAQFPDAWFAFTHPQDSTSERLITFALHREQLGVWRDHGGRAVSSVHIVALSEPTQRPTLRLRWSPGGPDLEWSESDGILRTSVEISEEAPVEGTPWTLRAGPVDVDPRSLLVLFVLR